MLQIREITDKTIWESLLTQKEISFYPLFQSWNWGEVQKTLGFSLLRLGLYDDEILVGVCLLIEVKARRGHYFHLRHGPMLIDYKKAYFEAFLVYIKQYARRKGASFLRISPFVKETVLTKEYLKSFGCVDAPMHNMDAEVCWVLDITKSEDQLLSEMRKTHRYLIRKAKGMELQILKTSDASEITKFINIYKNLSNRKHFVPHKGVSEEFTTFCNDDQAALFLAKYKGHIISGALILFVGNMAIYHHGASTTEYREIPASYLLQWEAISEAKRRGKTLYNFWGVAPTEDKKHPWYGLSLFKMGFGGQKETFIHAQDIPLNVLYWKTHLIEIIRKKMKGY